MTPHEAMRALSQALDQWRLTHPRDPAALYVHPSVLAWSDDGPSRPRKWDGIPIVVDRHVPDGTVIPADTHEAEAVGRAVEETKRQLSDAEWNPDPDVKPWAGFEAWMGSDAYRAGARAATVTEVDREQGTFALKGYPQLVASEPGAVPALRPAPQWLYDLRGWL